MKNLARVSTVKYDDMKTWIKNLQTSGHEILSVSVFTWEHELLATILYK